MKNERIEERLSHEKRKIEPTRRTMFDTISQLLCYRVTYVVLFTLIFATILMFGRK